MTGEEQFKELYRRYIHREGAEELLEWMERETDFFTAPASTKHHLAYPGGLVEHSVNVFRELRKVVIDNEPTMEAVAICALLHDLCKANTYVREHHAGPGEVYSYVKKGRFTAHARPDFQGTLDGGRSIIFEAKYTTTDAMKRDVLTETQMETLERHHRCGALAAVCVGIQDRFFFVPWPVWRDMKEAFGHMSVSAAELEDFRVRFTGAVLFLDYAHKIGGRWITGADCEIERWRRSK